MKLGDKVFSISEGTPLKLTLAIIIGLCSTLFVMGYNWRGVIMKAEEHERRFSVQDEKIKKVEEDQKEFSKKVDTTNQLLGELLLETRRGNKR